MRFARRHRAAGAVAGRWASILAVCAFVAASGAGGGSASVAGFSTNPNPSSVTLGTAAVTLQDSAFLSLAGNPGPTGAINFSLVYNGNTVHTEQATVTNNGTFSTVSGYTLPTFGGTVTGTYQWNADYSGDGSHSSIADDNNPNEQVTVSAASPTITTTPSTTSVTLGGPPVTLHDNATLSGGYHPGGTITFTLVYNGNTVDTEQVFVSGNGSYSTPTGYTLPTDGITVAGTYQWNASYSGDGNNNSASDDNDAAEQVTVNADSPTISSTPNTTDVTLGGPPPTLRDDAQLSGGYHAGGHITFTLVDPNGYTVDTEMVSVSGNGLYGTPTGYTVSAPFAAGQYQWNADYSGDGNNNSASDDNDAAEQVTVNPASPTISTTPNTTDATLGGPPVTLRDDAQLSGGFSPGGTITFTLVDPNGYTVDTEMVSVSGNGLYSTPTGYSPAGPVAAGTYQWNASYSGDDNNNSASDDNDLSEQVTVNPASPSLSSEPNTTSVGLGGPPVTLNDSADLSGGFDPGGTITFTLVDPNGNTVDTETVSVSGNGRYSTPTGYTPTAAGTYQWNADYSGDGNNNTASDDNDPAEQVSVHQVSADQPSVSAAEDGVATNTGTYSDFADAVSVSGPGVTDHGDGSWSWSGTGDESSPYQVTVTATYSDSSTATTTFDVSFTDVAPSVAADNASVSASENGVATNTGTYSDYDDSVSVSGPGVTDNGNGTWSWSGTGDEASPYSVTVTATNADGSQSTTSFNVSFTDVAPSVSADQASVSASENGVATNTGTYSDYDDSVSVSGPGVVDNGNGTWSWSGTGDEASPYSVTVTATNADGSQSTTTFDVSFTDVAPSVAADNASVSAAENGTATNTGTYSDYDDSVSVSGPGVTDNGNGTWSWSGTGDEASAYSVTVTATNADGSESTTTFDVSFTDVAPSVSAAHSTVNAPANGLATNSGTYSDYDDAVSVSGPGVVDNGDGTWSWSGAAGVTPFSVTVTATNGDGSVSTSSFNVVPVPPPVNRALPSIVGSAADGQTLKSKVGSWSSPEPLSYTFDWQRCASDGTGCSDVASTPWYKLSSADVGHTIQLIVTATDQEAQSTPATSALTAAVGDPPAPVNTALPSISGSAADGQLLSSLRGSWSSADHLTYTFDWQRCESDGSNCGDVSSSLRYRLSSADVGQTIQLVVTATDQEGQSTAATSALTGVVANPPAPINTELPSMTGSPVVGQYLKALRRAWSSPDHLTYAFDWQRCESDGSNCVDVASTPWYLVSNADLGFKLQLIVTVTDEEGQQAQATSLLVGPVTS